MSVRILSPEEVKQTGLALIGLGLAPVQVDSPEAIAGMLRRAAGFLAPCTRRELGEAVCAPLRGLVAGSEQLRARVDEMIEDLVACGDLLETEPGEGDFPSAAIYLAPPCFVARRSGSVILIGGLPDESSPLPDALRRRIKYNRHLRVVTAENGEDLRSVLRQLGISELRERLWLRPPKFPSANDLIQASEKALAGASVGGEPEGLQLLDSSKPVRYYKGRWVDLARQTGNFVARRPQRFGAALWCFVEVFQGQVRKLLDLPRDGWRGCDEAWHLQMAIDRSRGSPQVFRCRREDHEVVIDFFSPVPSWATRRLELLGRPVPPQECLLSYRLPLAEYNEEKTTLLEGALWLTATEDTAV